MKYSIITESIYITHFISKWNYIIFLNYVFILPFLCLVGMVLMGQKHFHFEGCIKDFKCHSLADNIHQCELHTRKNEYHTHE